MSEKEKLFVIPQKKMSLICEYSHDRITEIGKIDVPYTSKTVFTHNEMFVSLCFGSNRNSSRLKIFDKTGKQLIRKKEYKFYSLSTKNNVVYLGGRYIKNKGELFSYIDLNTISFDMTGVDLPIKSIPGKSIDDVLIRGNDLFLVDNIVYPKYIFHYDISTPDNPDHTSTRKLENNGTY
jgi:hypothetical protein